MAQPTTYFTGRDGFIWWFGVVEDRADPLSLGRVRVRVYGYHTDDKIKLPTIDLPWAFCIQPTTSASSGGVGSSPTGPIEGTWVIGFWRDPDFMQEPMVLGTLPGITPSSAAPPSTSPYNYSPDQRVPDQPPVSTTIVGDGNTTSFPTPADTTDGTVSVQVNGEQQSSVNQPPSSPNNIELSEGDYSGGKQWTAQDFSQSRFASNIASKINTLTPVLRDRWANGIQKFLADNSPELDCNISFAYRSLAQQQELRNNWAAGRGGYAAKPGFSWHNYASAIDLTIYYDNGQTYDAGTRGVTRYTQTARAAFEPFGLTNQIDGDSGHFYPAAFGKGVDPRLRAGTITVAELAAEKGLA
jgi:LAS superfamily LD-carboxypeptidase LdcB